MRSHRGFDGTMHVLPAMDTLKAIQFALVAFRLRHLKLRIRKRGHSSVGRAPALQAGSQGFESPCLHSRRPWFLVAKNFSHHQLHAARFLQTWCLLWQAIAIGL